MSTPSKAEPVVRGRTHPTFEGPIGNPKAGRLSRYSFIGDGGKRHFHARAVAAPEGENSFSDQERESLLGEK